MNFIKENKSIVGLVSICLTFVAIRLINSKDRQKKLEFIKETLKNPNVREINI